MQAGFSALFPRDGASSNCDSTAASSPCAPHTSRCLLALPRNTTKTTTGIGSVRSGLHPVQAVLANSHGSQCGFCTPGFVMSMYSLLRGVAAEGRGAPTEDDIEECLAGNLW